MAEYEVTRLLHASREDVFAVASDVERMAEWLPTTMDVSSSGPDVVHVEGKAEGHPYDTEGLFRAQHDQYRLEWGSRDTDDYSGWLQVHDAGADGDDATDGCSVDLHLSFRGDQPMAAGGHNEAHDQVEQGMHEALDRLAEAVARRT